MHARARVVCLGASCRACRHQPRARFDLRRSRSRTRGPRPPPAVQPPIQHMRSAFNSAGPDGIGCWFSSPLSSCCSGSIVRAWLGEVCASTSSSATRSAVAATAPHLRLEVPRHERRPVARPARGAVRRCRRPHQLATFTRVSKLFFHFLSKMFLKLLRTRSRLYRSRFSKQTCQRANVPKLTAGRGHKKEHTATGDATEPATPARGT